VAAVPNPTWSASGAGEPNNDEYEATVTAPMPGTYDHAFRFSRDGGLTWTYCDSGGSQDGYQVAEAGNLVTEASACTPNPCIAPPPPVCLDASTLTTYTSPGTCALEGGEAVCDWPEVLVQCPPATTCSEGQCVATGGPAAPLPGQVVITEIMYNTEGEVAVSSNEQGEWFELFNATGGPLDLAGCVLKDGSTTTTTIGPLVVEGGAYVVFSKPADPTKNGGIEGTYAFGFALNNSNDSITLTCGVDVIDTVAYGSGWPPAVAKALSLSPAKTNATDNDLSGSWCSATTAYYSGTTPHYGTPGLPNPPCP
jgi:hypothetical protein